MKVEATFKLEIQGQVFTLTIEELRALKKAVDGVLCDVNERPQPMPPIIREVPYHPVYGPLDIRPPFEITSQV